VKQYEDYDIQIAPFSLPSAAKDIRKEKKKVNSGAKKLEKRKVSLLRFFKSVKAEKRL